MVSGFDSDDSFLPRCGPLLDPPVSVSIRGQVALLATGVSFGRKCTDYVREKRRRTVRSDERFVHCVGSHYEGLGWAKAFTSDESSGFDPADSDQSTLFGEAVPVPICRVRTRALYGQVYVERGVTGNVFECSPSSKLPFFADHIWKEARKRLNPTFNQRIIHGFVPIFAKCAEKMVARLSECVDGETVNIHKYTALCTLEMACGTTLGSDVLQREGKEEFERGLDQ